MTRAGDVRHEGDDWRILTTDDWETLRYQGPEGEADFLFGTLRCAGRAVYDPATGRAINVVDFCPAPDGVSGAEHLTSLEQIWPKVRAYVTLDGGRAVVTFPSGLWRSDEGVEWHQPSLPTARHPDGWTVEDWIDSSRQGDSVVYSDELCTVRLRRSIEHLEGYGGMLTVHAPVSWADAVVEGDAVLAAQRARLILSRVAAEYLDRQWLVRIAPEEAAGGDP